MSLNEQTVAQLAAELAQPPERIEALLRDHAIKTENEVPVWHGDLKDLLAADLARPATRETDCGRIFAAANGGSETELFAAADLAECYIRSEEEIEAALAALSPVIPGHWPAEAFAVLDAAFLPGFDPATASAKGNRA